MERLFQGPLLANRTVVREIIYVALIRPDSFDRRFS